MKMINKDNNQLETFLTPKYWRIKTPTVIQMEAVECGPASLSIILAHYGKYIPLEELRHVCAVSRHGSSCINLLKAAGKYDLEAGGFRMELHELQHSEEPCILFWKFQHFIVLEGFSKDKVYINDPQTGPRQISYQELDEGFTGIALKFKPTKAFKREGRPPSLLKDIYSRLKNTPGPLVFFALTGFCLLLPGLALPAFSRVFIDVILNKNTHTFNGVFFGSLISFAAIAALLTGLQQYLLLRLNAKLSIQFSSDFLWHILRLPLSFYTQRYSGEIGYRMLNNSILSQAMTGALATTSIDLFLIIFYGVVIFFYDPMIASIGWSAAILALIAMGLGLRSRKDACARLQQEMGQSIGTSIEALNHIETVKGSGLESRFFSRWGGLYVKNINAQQDLGKKDALLSVLPLFLQSIAIASLLVVGSYRILQGSLTIGMLIALQILLISFLLPVNRFINFGQTIQQIKIYLGRLNDVMQNPVDKIYIREASKKPEGPPAHAKLSGRLEFRNVTFGYSLFEPPLVENLSFILKPGQKIALVGPTASGKTTIAKLASNLLHPWSGEILFDGKTFFELLPELFHRSLAHVDQEIFLFEGTVRDNLTLWDSHVPDEELHQAVADAGLSQELFSRPQGLDYLLREEGRNLSSGERQRMEIARALAVHPSLLVLDEATSGLDSEKEKQISNNIRRRACSCLMIAHRLSTVKDCDEILVLDKGKIVQRGTHDELKTIPGIYRDLVERA
jgi:ATP-binding cassette, subfamily C, bacterial